MTVSGDGTAAKRAQGEGLHGAWYGPRLSSLVSPADGPHQSRSSARPRQRLTQTALGHPRFGHDRIGPFVHPNLAHELAVQPPAHVLTDTLGIRPVCCFEPPGKRPLVIELGREEEQARLDVVLDDPPAQVAIGQVTSWVHRPRSRGARYAKRAISTCSRASRVRAWRWKMLRITEVRSRTSALSSSAR